MLPLAGDVSCWSHAACCLLPRIRAAKWATACAACAALLACMQAGGFVADGRVNGSLNLSRALGDLEYKQTKELGPEEQVGTGMGARVEAEEGCWLRAWVQDGEAGWPRSVIGGPTVAMVMQLVGLKREGRAGLAAFQLS